MSAFYGAARAVIENEDGEILMVKEGKNHIEETWDFPGGGWENEESILDCVRREVLEETGFEVRINRLLGIYKEQNQEDGTETIVFMFEASIEAKEKEEPVDNEEIIGAEFFAPEEIEELDLRHPNRKEILRKYREEDSYELEAIWNELELLD